MHASCPIANSSRCSPTGSRPARREGRRLHLSQTFEGTWFVDGGLDPISGEAVSKVLKRIEGELFEAHWAEATRERVADVRARDLARTPPSDGSTRWSRWRGGPEPRPPEPACRSRS